MSVLSVDRICRRCSSPTMYDHSKFWNLWSFICVIGSTISGLTGVLSNKPSIHYFNTSVQFVHKLMCLAYSNHSKSMCRESINSSIVTCVSKILKYFPKSVAVTSGVNSLLTVVLVTWTTKVTRVTRCANSVTFGTWTVMSCIGI
uniref:Uncharacterized protein n=1 Tax=Cacopsylla melanoneura TaxID=428564 RepID=A0A8D8VA29_9HEMI